MNDMNRQQKLLGYYNYTVVLTYIGMLSGFVGITYAFGCDTLRAIVCLMIAGLCDMFDGTIASTMERTRQEKSFGIQIDSLSDLICFGVLPAVIVYSMNQASSFALGVCAMYVLCALIRLAYFNVDEQERQLHSNECREIYYGMPVTLSAIFVPLIYTGTGFFSLKANAALIAALFTMAIAFLLPFQMRKPKIIGKMCMLLCGLFEVILVVYACIGG